MVADALTVKAVGLIVDPEKPYRKRSKEAAQLVELLDVALDEVELAVCVTSYGSVWWFNDFPWQEFAKLDCSGSPQVYDSKNNLSLDHADKAYEAYERLGFSPIIMSGPGFNKTKAQLKRLLNSYPNTIEGVIFWDWANLRLRKNKHLWDVIRDYRI
jgi:hypothetical protein